MCMHHIRCDHGIDIRDRLSHAYHRIIDIRSYGDGHGSSIRSIHTQEVFRSC